MTYNVKRPSETRHRGGRGPAPSTTTKAPARTNPALGPAIGSYYGLGKKKAAKGADAKPTETKEPDAKPAETTGKAARRR